MTSNHEPGLSSMHDIEDDEVSVWEKLQGGWPVVVSFASIVIILVTIIFNLFNANLNARFEHVNDSIKQLQQSVDALSRDVRSHTHDGHPGRVLQKIEDMQDSQHRLNELFHKRLDTLEEFQRNRK